VAIELAAALTRVLTVGQLAARLNDDRFHLLTRARSARPAHHRALLATVDWSFQLCTPTSQLICSVCRRDSNPCPLHIASVVGQSAPVGISSAFTCSRYVPTGRRRHLWAWVRSRGVRSV
jgi:hypothetical protein